MNWLFKDADQSTTSINGDYSFTVQQQPSASLAETNSNLSVISFRSKAKKDALPAKVRWWKVKNGQSSELLGVRGTMYPCEPSDLGYKIKAEINSVDEEMKGTAVVWFGPIKIQAGIRQTLTNIINSGHTMFPIFICSGKETEREGVIKINESQIIVTDNKSNKQLNFPYNLSQPRMELNPKDLYRLCLRFKEQNHEAHLKNFMNESFGLNISNSRLSDSSQFLKPSNKLQLKFISRHSRDLVTFSMKAFATKREMKANAIIQKIQRLDLNQQQQFKQFFEYQGIKQQIIRMDQLCKEAMKDRDRKTRDLKNLEQQIANITLTYLNIINDKCKNNQQLNESVSIITNKNRDLKNKNRIFELQTQVNELKTRVRDQYQEIQLLKFLGKPDNNIIPQSNNSNISNPFTKKKSQTFGVSESALELSKANRKLVEEVDRLRRIEEQHFKLHRSKSHIQLENMLESIGDGNRNNDTSVINPSFINRSMNQSAQIRLLQQKFVEIKQLNQKLLKENEYYKMDSQRKNREIDSLKKELTLRPSDSVMILPPNINSHNSEEELESLKQEYRVLNNKYQEVLKIGDLKSKAMLEADYYKLKSEHNRCQDKIRNLQYQLTEAERHKGFSSVVMSPELQKLKLINVNLLNEVNTLKIELQKISQEKEESSMRTLNKRIFQLQTQLNNLKQPSSEPINQELAGKLFNADNKIKQLQQQCRIKQLKIKTLDGIIQKLMSEMNQKNMSLDQSNITSNSLSRYKRRIKDLQVQNDMLKRSTNALNKSRDLSMQMVDYNGQMVDTLKQEMDSLLKEHQRISVICERYAKDAKELRQQNSELRSCLQKNKKE